MNRFDATIMLKPEKQYCEACEKEIDDGGLYCQSTSGHKYHIECAQKKALKSGAYKQSDVLIGEIPVFGMVRK